MKNFKFMLFPIFLILSINTNAQKVFGLVELIDLSNCITLSEFDKKVRKNGFIFNESEKFDEYKAYRYKREILFRDITWTIVVHYCDYSDGKPAINYVSTFEEDYSNIQKLLSANGFKENGMESEGKELTFKYKSKSHVLNITFINSKIGGTNESYNKYSISIYKR